jgi:multiple sugar transport system substrate-binding protein
MHDAPANILPHASCGRDAAMDGSMTTAALSGITWNHTRGYLPLAATAQRFADHDPGVEIVWHKRSLQEFADVPIERLAERFDLLVVDHPFVGYAAAHPTLVPLDEHLPADFLADQAANSVGRSYESYLAGGHLWALPIDAATPVSAHRPDLLDRHGVRRPETWEDLLALARRGMVALPAIPIDALMAFYMLTLSLGEEPFQRDGEVVGPATGVAALEALRELVALCEPACLERNPIRTYEAMVARDDLVYCPFAYGYSTYARPDYARPSLRFGGLVAFAGRRLRSTLGGTGLAISRRCRNLELALAYARFVADPACQRGLYAAAGGQPGHRAAWLDPEVNARAGGFYRDTLATLDEAYLRPRHDGYIPFQDRAGEAVHAYLRNGGDASRTLEELNAHYCGSGSDGRG